MESMTYLYLCTKAAPTRFALKYFDVLEKSSTIHVALASSVVGLDADTSRSAVRTLTYFHHSSGTTHQLAIDPAQPVVLAGGGISNAQLLLQPRSDGAVPVGNESDQAGKFLMEHPHFRRVAELVLDEDLNLQPRPAAFGGATHAMVPDDALDDAARAIRVQCGLSGPNHRSSNGRVSVQGAWEALLSLHQHCTI